MAGPTGAADPTGTTAVGAAAGLGVSTLPAALEDDTADEGAVCVAPVVLALPGVGAAALTTGAGVPATTGAAFGSAVRLSVVEVLTSAVVDVAPDAATV
ncbi:MAG: hypothetical protein NVSMB60_27850 [Mycobacterium sp.]